MHITTCKVTDGSFRNGRQCKAVLTDCELIVDFDRRQTHSRVGALPSKVGQGAPCRTARTIIIIELVQN